MAKAEYKKPQPKVKKIISMVVLTIVLAIAATIVNVFVDKENIDTDWSDNSIKILFVGNSHVFTGNVPKQLKTLAKMYGVEVSYRDISRNGASLNDSKEKAIDEMQNSKFDYVVLQDRNTRPIDDVNGFLDDAQILIDAARENGAIPVLYNPAWTNINGQPNKERQETFTEAYKRAADENDAALVNAGDAWVYAYQTIPGISLYNKFDLRGSYHANKAGAFYTACVFAATLFDLHIEDITEDNLYKKIGESGTQLVLLTPKTEGSVRRLYLNKYLKEDIDARLSQIEKDKQYYGDAYNNYGLLICLPNGDPVERTRMQRWFKNWQAKVDVEIKIDMQGLRKSGAMYKLRLSDYDYQAVQLETGHSTPNVLMEHYNEVMVSEKSRLAEKFENDFYASREVKAESIKTESKKTGVEELLQAVMADPEKLAMLTKLMALQPVQV